MLADLDGQIERITYSNKENGFTIARVKVQGTPSLVTVVGNMIDPMPGEILKMKGEWRNHPAYGEQFRIIEYKTSVPVSIQGICKYLGSGLIKGIGPIMAERITASFGEKTLNILEENIERLTEVDGIGLKRLQIISNAWNDQKEIRDVMLFLQSHGVSSGYATKIYKRYGQSSVTVVKKNPYRLATDIYGIGFVVADQIAKKMGFDKNSPLRAEAGILYVLQKLSDNGHVFYPYRLLLEKCFEILKIDAGIISNMMEVMASEKRVVIETLNEDIDKNKGERKAVYLPGYHERETEIAATIRKILNTSGIIRKIDTEKAVQWVQDRLKINLAEEQLRAIIACLNNKVAIITGGPGTGKTTIIGAILEIVSKLNVKILLAAPTGRAAKRMFEATGRESKTIHRMLDYSIKIGGFQKNEKNPLDCGLIIIDEASMIDVNLMHYLLKAIPLTANLVLVGDVNQLPSVGPGNVLRDIIKSNIISVIHLKKIFRQAKKSLIVYNAHRINTGKLPQYKTCSDGLDDFYFIEQEEPEEVLRIMLELIKDRVPKRFGLDPFDDIQVLTPMHKGVAGSEHLNMELQKTLNGGKEGLIRGEKRFQVKDKVMQIKNNYDKDVFNGDLGRISAINTETQSVVISFDRRDVVYDFSELDEIVLAYAISIHKSQGSEYPAVIIPLLTQHFILLQRNLIYTGMTRGKKLVILVGSTKALSIAVRNNKMEHRYTYLHQRLICPKIQQQPFQ